MSENRYLRVLQGTEGPTPEDYRRAGVAPLSPEEAKALAAWQPPSEGMQHAAASPPTPEEQALLGVSTLVAKWGFEELSSWLKRWAKQQTFLHTWGQLTLPVGERLHLWMGLADDRADLWFNDESLNHKNLGEEGTWSITGGLVKKGPNVIVVGLNNSGRGRYSVQVVTTRASTGARVEKACLTIQDDEGPFTGRMHIYFIQVTGV